MRTWASLSVAINVARDLAIEAGERQLVKREDGEDNVGKYRFRIVPAEVAEPCS